MSRGSAWLLLVSLSLLAACGDDAGSPRDGVPDVPAPTDGSRPGAPAPEPSGPGSEQPGPQDPNPPAATRRVVLLIEQNRDGFPEPLAEEEALEGAPPVDLVMTGGLKIRADVARSLEGGYLAEAGVHLMDPKVSLARCQLVVLHQILYRGKGREGSLLRVYGFPATEGSVPLALPAPPEAIEHDPATDPRDLLARLEDLRLSPGGGGSFAIRSAGETALVFDAFGAEKRVEPMGSAEWGVTRRKIRVRELALLASAFDPEGLPPGDPNEEVFPATDYGEVEFSTEWGALYLGVMPLVVEEPAVAGGDFR